MQAQAQDVKCPQGYQPYANRCVSQRMGDYISCVEAAGGNRETLSEEISKTVGGKTSGEIKAQGGTPLVKGAGSAVLDRASEQAIARKFEQKWYSNSMQECSKALDLPAQVAKAIEQNRLRTTNEEKAQHRRIRRQLGAFLLEGQALQKRCAEESSPPPEADTQAWAQRTEAFLEKELGTDYVASFRSGADLPMVAVAISSTPHRNLWGAIRIRVARLEQFLQQLRT
jgi:hypothetical protein